ncbi:MAG: Cytochrome, partial [Methylobacterium sp.]|nr:Cytochrome [Methylobacterium sp.]
ILPDDSVLDADTLPKVRMPNRDGFTPDVRPDVPIGAR